MQSIRMTTPGKILWSLPSDLLGSFMETFLSPHDVIRLDQSCCARETRPFYLEALRDHCVMKVLHVGLGSFLSLVKWMESRAARVHHLTIQEYGKVKLESIATGSVLDHITAIELTTTMWSPCAARTVSMLSVKVASKVRKITFNDNIAYDGDAFDPTWLDGSELRNLQELTCSVGSECTEWTLRLIENNPHLHTLDVRCYNEDQAFFNRLSRSTSVRRLTVDLCDGVVSADSIIDRIASCYPNLEYLTISTSDDTYPGIVSAGLLALARKCPQLQEVHFPEEIKLSDPALVEFFATAHRLRVFNWEAPVRFNNAMLLALAESNGGVPHLEELGMHVLLKRGDINQQCEAALGHLRRCCGVLPDGTVYATAYKCMRNLVDVRAIEEDLGVIAKNFPALRTLSIEAGMWPRAFNPHILLRYLQKNPLLESLNLDNIRVAADLLTVVTLLCPNLRTLTATAPITGVTTKDLVDLARHCPRLVKLNLHMVGEVFTDEVLTALGDHCYYLEELRLPHPVRINEAGLTALVASCKHLRVIRGCQRIPSGWRRKLRVLAGQRGRLLQLDDEMGYIMLD